MPAFPGRSLAAIAILASVCASAAHAGEVPEKKRTESGLYVTAAEAARLHARQSDAILIDIRSRADVAFVGIAEGVDKHIPYMVVDEFWEFDEDRGTYKLVVNPDFQEAVETYLQSREVAPDAPIMLICRSGNRSARAANLMNRMGYRNVYSVIDGFEGDKGPEGVRNVNGWKNEGLPWSYRIMPDISYESPSF